MRSFTILAVLMALVSCNDKKAEPKTITPDQISIFSSSDQELVKSYEWARKTALRYAHDNTDPVGYWYEAALPNREAFCMRDVSHQTTAGEILGLSKHNANMMTRFMENISESKDWCTYWEINRHNKPAPVDYANDKEFWYNLNANFDVIDACYRLYKWTGDEKYINSPEFVNFYQKSANEYIERWQLQPDKIMDRPLYMNSPEPFDPSKSFHASRGLASYVESFGGITASADLIATIYAGFKALSEIEKINNNATLSSQYAEMANQYKSLLNTIWWNNDTQSFYTYWTDKKEFHRGEGETFILWNGATTIPERITSILSNLLSREWNVENLSYFPELLYRYNYNRDAYDLLLKLPGMKRSEYPEVSFGVVEGIVGGMMGLKPDFTTRRIFSLPRMTSQTAWAEIQNVPVFGGYISVKHESIKSSIFTNNTSQSITWRVSFMGEFKHISYDGKDIETNMGEDPMGNRYSYIDIELQPKETVKATAI